MTIPRSRRIGAVLALSLTTALVAGATAEEALKGPAYLLIQGPGLDGPVVLHQGPGGINWDVNSSEVSRLLGSRSDEAAAPSGARYYEVFEFWYGSSLTPAPLSDGSPSSSLVPEHASSVSRIYTDEPGGAVWNAHLQPLGDPSQIPPPPPLADGIDALHERQAWLRSVMDGASIAPPFESTAVYRRLSEAGIALLESHGLTFGR